MARSVKYHLGFLIGPTCRIAMGGDVDRSKMEELLTYYDGSASEIQTVDGWLVEDGDVVDGVITEYASDEDGIDRPIASHAIRATVTVNEIGLCWLVWPNNMVAIRNVFVHGVENNIVAATAINGVAI
jgi:hypothetical protein